MPVLLLVAVWVLLVRRIDSAAGAMSLGRSQHKVYDRKDLRTTFADVAGVDEAVEELREVVDFLQHPQRYQRLGGASRRASCSSVRRGRGRRCSRGRSRARRTCRSSTSSGSDFVEMFVGLGAARVRDLFEQAKAKAPCIVFIDELDTIGKSRAGAAAGPSAATTSASRR